MKFKDYHEVRDWLESFIPLVYGKEELGLARIENLLGKSGNPQNKFKSIHVAGTSGKGSTCWYIAKLLQQETNKSVILGSETTPESSLFVDSGQSQNDKKSFKVGLHISPHLVDIRERMQIFESQSQSEKSKSNLMPMGRFLKLFSEIKPVVDGIQREKPELTPSYFEILVAASFKYFAEEKVDWAVVEVGLGGRLDATNVLKPKVSVITNIGLDHTEILGKTIEKIAYEKAGIIKTGVPVVTGCPSTHFVRSGSSTSGKALEVIKEVAKNKGSKVYKISTQDYKNRLIEQINPAQAKNAVLALKTIEVLYSSRYPALRERKENRGVTAFSLRHPELVSGSKEGSRYTRTVKQVFAQNFAGRFEEIQPGVILDGAHNPDKIKYLIDFVISNFKFQISNKNNILRAEREVSLKTTNSSKGKFSHSVRTISGVVLVVGFKKGKNWQKMVDLLVKNLPIKQVIATKFHAVTDTGPPRLASGEAGRFAAVEPEEIADYAKSKWKVKVESRGNSQEAVFEAVNASVIASTFDKLSVNSVKQSKLKIAASFDIQCHAVLANAAGLELRTRNDKRLVLVTGSLYLVGEVRTLWKLPEF